MTTTTLDLKAPMTRPLTAEDLPDCKFTNTGQPRTAQSLTRANAEKALAWLGLGVRFNMMIQAVTYYRWSDAGAQAVPAADAGAVALTVEDSLKMADVTGLADLERILEQIARADCFHPMADWLAGLPQVPAGADPIGDLISKVRTADPDWWAVALEVWLVQVVEGVCGWQHGRERGLRYCLTLQGPQGIGKTQFFRDLGAGWCKTEAELQLGGLNSEEHQLRALRWPMCELAEVDGITRKADVEHLKAFMTRAVDELRRKYARHALVMPRMTSFCATCNGGAILNDPTGWDRWLCVAVESIDWTAQVDYAGVWRAAYDLWAADGYRMLDAAEKRMQAAAAAQFIQESPEAETLAAHLEHCEGQDYDVFAVTVTDVCEAFDFGRSMPARNAVREFLLREIGKPKQVAGRRNAWPIPLLSRQQMMLSDAVKLPKTHYKRAKHWKK